MLDITITNETDLPDKTADALALVAALTTAADCMKRLGLTKEQAAERAIAAALHEARAQALDDAIACVPGGNICDPQDVADAIRALKVETTP